MEIQITDSSCLLGKVQDDYPFRFGILEKKQLSLEKWRQERGTYQKVWTTSKI